MKGDPANGKYVENIRFEKLAFTASDATPVEGGKGPLTYYPGQAANAFDALFEATGARREILRHAPLANAFNVLEDCVIRDGGRYNAMGTGVVIGHPPACRGRMADMIPNPARLMEVNATPLPGEGGWRNPPPSAPHPVSSTQRKYRFAFTSGNDAGLRAHDRDGGAPNGARYYMV